MSAPMLGMSNDEFVRHLDAVCVSYRGDVTQLEAAIGMLIAGRSFGWRVMYLMHSASTIRKYEKILDLKIRDVLPQYGKEARRSNAYKLLMLADGIKENFWKVVNGVYPNIKSTKLGDPEELPKGA